MTNLQDFFEKSRKLGFPRIMKLTAMSVEMKKQALKDNVAKDDLVIVRVTTWYSNDKPGNYSFEKIIGDPVSYLLKKLYETEEESEERLDAIPSDD